MSLTKRQKQVFEFLRDYLDEYGYSPTLEEIAQHFRIASLNAVYKHLRALEARGFIKRLSNQARSIQVLEVEPKSQWTLPLLGTVAAGQPIEAVTNVEEVTVPETFLTRGNNYVLQVSGESMIEEHIADGDLVVVEERDSAQNGQMVVALVDGENVTLKKYFREGGQIRLQPANPEIEPILVPEDRVRIQGIVVGVMRKY